jgi:CBS domain containing-hemolysin-like protein
MQAYLLDSMKLVSTFILVALNGFFVAAEFALVKVRGSKLEGLVEQGRPFAKTAQWLYHRQDASLSACQLGITMASLGLGWIGEPALAHLLHPLLHAVGITSEAALHSIAFILAFTAITAAHIVIGEQAPKIYAIRTPEPVFLWCALPLKGFYLISYPFMVSLNAASNLLLRLAGSEDSGHHDSAHSEDEIRALIRHAHAKGELTRTEDQLINAVFEFDDQVCRQIMVPRGEVIFLNLEDPFAQNLDLVKRSSYTRFPLCRDSLDEVVGVVHIKDLVGVTSDDSCDLTQIARPPHKVPETVPISRLLRHFQSTRQHLAFVVDEHGTTIGIVTLENVLEQIVGAVQDEFDTETPAIVPDGSNQFLVRGDTSIEILNTQLGLTLHARDVDTFSGLLMEQVGRIPRVGDKVDFNGSVAEVLEIRQSRATRIRLTLPKPVARDSTGKS